MRITVNKGLCSGHARCNAVAPHVYPLDECGYSAIESIQVAPADEQGARDGAEVCPERAITLTD
jgi:ferredoxin